MKISKINQVGMLSLHVIVPVVLAIAAIGGIGAYVISTSSAAGWTKLYSSWNSNSTVAYSMYACKKPIPKMGYQVKSYASILSVKGTQPKTTVAYKMHIFLEKNVSSPAFGANISPTSLKAGMTLSGPISTTYGTLSTKFGANLLEMNSSGNPLNSSIKGNYSISSLSTCP